MLESIARAAVECDICFRDGRLKRPLVDVAQPRWIGPDYWQASPRVVIVALNPGGGSEQQAEANKVFVSRLHEFRATGRGLQQVFDHQAIDMPNWGRVPGRFTRFYFDCLQLDFRQVALANIAWCATAGNKYPDWMLTSCFERHTSTLLAHLAPDAVLLSGTKTHRFAAAVTRLLPRAKIVQMLHYAHRESPVRERTELDYVRLQLHALRAQDSRRRSRDPG